MFERFTDRSRRVLVLAQEEARRLGHGFIGTEHLLLGLLHHRVGLAARVLEARGLTVEWLRDQVEALVPGTDGATGVPPFSPRAKHVLELSTQEADGLGGRDVEPEHLLLALVREGEGTAVAVLAAVGVDAVRLRQDVVGRLPVRVTDLPHRPLVPLPGRAGVEPATLTVDPSTLVTPGEAAAVMRGLAAPRVATTVHRLAHGVEHAVCSYAAVQLPEVVVAVAGADVTAEAFDELVRNGAYQPVEGVGHAAAFDAPGERLLVRHEALVFSVAAYQHPDARAVAVHLARGAVARLADPPAA